MKTHDLHTPVSAEQGLKRLIDGNERFLFDANFGELFVIRVAGER